MEALHLPAYEPDYIPSDACICKAQMGMGSSHIRIKGSSQMFLPSLGCTWRTPSENFLQVLWLWLNQECLLSSRDMTVKVRSSFSREPVQPWALSLRGLWGCELVSSLARGVGSRSGSASSEWLSESTLLKGQSAESGKKSGLAAVWNPA